MFFYPSADADFYKLSKFKTSPFTNRKPKFEVLYIPRKVWTCTNKFYTSY